MVVQVGGSTPRPPQRFSKAAFPGWVAQLRRQSPQSALHAVYEACGFGFGLQRCLTSLGVRCEVVAPQKLDERQSRVKTDGRDARTLCLKLSRYVEGNKEELAVVRVPSAAEEEARALHRQREQLVRTRKQLEAHGRSLLVNHGCEPGKGRWWKERTFAALAIPLWLRQLLSHTQPLLLALESQIQKAHPRAGSRRRARSAARSGPPEQCRDRLRGLRLAPLQEPAPGRQLHRPLPGRIQQRQDPAPGLRDQARQPQTESRPGRDRLAPRPLPARVSRRQKMAPLVRQRRPGHRRTKKKAIVAVARQLAVDLWRLRTGRVSAQTLGLVEGPRAQPAQEEGEASKGNRKERQSLTNKG